ncbi:hypothetical protein [Flavihumibacter petaseus]|uniref:hypothetical protein n=1 Tax=Flavihumibacter petaseus TaxID=549295 RepID=UPI0012F91E0A|nr:hypothetical protein [Flavihumibacter petaseus]
MLPCNSGNFFLNGRTTINVFSSLRHSATASLHHCAHGEKKARNAFLFFAALLLGVLCAKLLPSEAQQQTKRHSEKKQDVKKAPAPNDASAYTSA